MFKKFKLHRILYKRFLTQRWCALKRTSQGLFLQTVLFRSKTAKNTCILAKFFLIKRPQNTGSDLFKTQASRRTLKSLNGITKKMQITTIKDPSIVSRWIASFLKDNLTKTTRFPLEHQISSSKSKRLFKLRSKTTSKNKKSKRMKK
jgi:hypothetical protein